MRLNIGCGFKKLEGYINIDSRGECNPDECWDITYRWWCEDNSVDEVKAFDVLEHIPPDRVMFVMSEIHRVLKPDGFLDFMIPSTDGRGAFQDPTHRSWWNVNSWLYYCHPNYWKLYPETPRFKIVSQIGDISLGPSEMRLVYTVGKVSPIKGGKNG